MRCRVRRWFAGASIMLLAVGCLVLVIAWIKDPELLTRTEKVVAFVGGLIPVGTVVAVVGRGMRRSLHRQKGNVSAGLTSWLGDEPLLLALIWSLIVVEVVVATFFLPIYSIRLEVVSPGADWNGIRVVAQPRGLPLRLAHQVADRTMFASENAVFRWGDDIVVYVRGGPAGAADSIPVVWSSFALLHLFSGYRIGSIELARPRAHVLLNVNPTDATVVVYSEGRQKTLVGPQELDLAIGTLDVGVSAPDYEPFRQRFLIRGDMTIPITLHPQRVNVTFAAEDYAGNPVPGLSVYVDGERVSRVGEEMKLAKGSHAVRMQRCLSNGERLAVEEFTVRLRPGLRDTTVVARARSDSGHCGE